MSNAPAEVRFEQEGSELTAIEIVRSSRSPLIVPLYRVLLGLGIVISTYHARPSATRARLTERIVIQRRDGGALDAQLSAATKAAVLPFVLEVEPDA